MMRFLGVLVGSAFAVAALVVFVGIPEFTAEPNVTEPTVITLPMRAAGPATAAATDTPPEPVPDEAPAEPLPDIPADAPPDAPPQPPDPEPAATPQWYAFWSPFRSEVAANGFVDQLQRVTGLDYRVVKVKPGVYEVAFAYEDDQDIIANLSQISAATGLQLPES
ncbi:MAG TPA: hypothetical protein VK854_14535 [Woeseiaceae bacterium]|nr:hypothetical protein [Woeseiaceae bacterium]